MCETDKFREDALLYDRAIYSDGRNMMDIFATDKEVEKANNQAQWMDNYYDAIEEMEEEFSD